MAHEESAAGPAAVQGAAVGFAAPQDHLTMVATSAAWETILQPTPAAPRRAGDDTAQYDLLLDELNHRLRNSLQSLLSYLSLRTRQAKSRNVRQALSDVRKQVIAIAVVHEEISVAATLEAGVLLRRIVTHLRSIADSTRRIGLEFELADVTMDPRLASSLGMIAAELVWNSYKHGFPRRRSGTIAISLAATPAEIALIVRDTGAGLKQKRAKPRAGTGLAMVQKIAKHHRGRMVVGPETPEGTRITVFLARA